MNERDGKRRNPHGIEQNAPYPSSKWHCSVSFYTVLHDKLKAFPLHKTTNSVTLLIAVPFDQHNIHLYIYIYIEHGGGSSSCC